MSEECVGHSSLGDRHDPLSVAARVGSLGIRVSSHFDYIRFRLICK
jgi:hypothetical protein